MQAVQNLGELGKDDFETVKAKAQKRWDEVLGRIEVAGGTVGQYRTFYSCLYRSTLFPRKFYEIDKSGNPVHYSPYNGEVLPGYMYTDTGFWDTFRSLFPLLNLVYPSVNAEIQAGLANAYRESGFLPEWASPGHHPCPIMNGCFSLLWNTASEPHFMSMHRRSVRFWRYLKESEVNDYPRHHMWIIFYSTTSKLSVTI